MPKLTFLLLLFASLTVCAQVGGLYTYNFLDLSENARVAALGGQNVSLSDDDPNMFKYNPATINNDMMGGASFNVAPFVTGISKFSTVYGHKLKGKINLVGAVESINYGSFLRTDIAGNELGEVSASETAITVGTSHQIDNYRIGVNLKLVSSNVADYFSFATLMDIGGLYVHPRKDLKIGLVFKNVGAVVKKYHSDADMTVPFDVQFGLSYKLEHMPLRFNMLTHHLHVLDVQYLDPTRTFTFDDLGEEVPGEKQLSEKIARHFTFGGEFVFSKNFYLRAGYNHLRRRELKLENAATAAGFSFGGMMRMRGFEFNYTRAIYHVSGGTNLITISTNFGYMFKNGLKSTGETF